MLMRFLKF